MRGLRRPQPYPVADRCSAVGARGRNDSQCRMADPHGQLVRLHRGRSMDAGNASGLVRFHE